jgi:hypothetical protein
MKVSKDFLIFKKKSESIQLKLERILDAEDSGYKGGIR